MASFNGYLEHYVQGLGYENGKFVFAWECAPSNNQRSSLMVGVLLACSSSQWPSLEDSLTSLLPQNPSIVVEGDVVGAEYGFLWHLTALGSPTEYANYVSEINKWARDNNLYIDPMVHVLPEDVTDVSGLLKLHVADYAFYRQGGLPAVVSSL